MKNLLDKLIARLNEALKANGDIDILQKLHCDYGLCHLIEYMYPYPFLDDAEEITHVTSLQDEIEEELIRSGRVQFLFTPMWRGTEYIQLRIDYLKSLKTNQS